MMTEDELRLYGSFLVLCTTTFLLMKRNRRTRRFKVRPMNRTKKQHGHFHTLYKFMKERDHEQFFKYTRMTPQMFDHLLDLVKPYLQKTKSKNPISPEERLLITIHYLSEGSSKQQVAWEYYIGKATAHRIINETCDVLWDLLQPLYLKPPSQEEFINISRGYFNTWNMPNCLGALDGKHINMEAPAHSGSDFFNYKKSFSIVLMATCDAFYRFTLVDIGAAGSNHDGHIFSESLFGTAVLHEREDLLKLPKAEHLPGTNTLLPYFFIADQAFPLHERIMRPYPGENLGDRKNIFNYRLSRARRTIENTFGIFAQRWRLFRNNIISNVENVEKYVKAAVVLHNYIQSTELEMPPCDRKYCPTGFVDTIGENGQIQEGAWRNQNGLRRVGRVGANNAAVRVKENRDILAHYFDSEVGGVPWQYENSSWSSSCGL